MKYLVKIGYHTRLIFGSMKAATKAMESLNAGMLVEERHVLVGGRYRAVVFPSNGAGYALETIEDDQLRASEVKVDDNDREIGTADVMVSKQKPRRRGLLLGNGS